MKVEIIGSDRLVKSREGDAAYDLYSAEDIDLYPGEIRIVDTDVKIALPANLCALVLPRSGLGSNGITVANSPGLIDPNYRGPIKVALINHSMDLRKFERGSRIAQVLFVPFVEPDFDVVENFTSDTERGEQGFGSSGI